MSPDDKDAPRPPLLPVHAVPLDGDGRLLKIRRRPGRPRHVARQPDADERAYIEELNQARRDHVAGDNLVGAVAEGDGRGVIHQAEVGLAIEAASLAWEIEQGQNAGKDTAQVSSRRIDALTKLASVVLARRKLFAQDIDDHVFGRTRDLFTKTVADVLLQTLGADRAEPFIVEIRWKLDVGRAAVTGGER